MKTKLIHSFQMLAAFALVSVLMATASCSKQGGEHSHDPNVDYYTCSMHPSVKLHDPKAEEVDHGGGKSVSRAIEGVYDHQTVGIQHVA